MQMNAIDTFLAIAATGSFHAAAERLNVTQTTVSARIRTLEQTLGMALFDRGPAGTRISAAGQQFRPYAEQLQRTWQFVATGLPGTLGDRVSLRLGAQLSMWDPLLVDVAVWLEQEQGKVPLTLNYDHTLNMAEAVVQQLLDLAIVTEAPIGTRLAVEDLPEEELVLVSDQQVDLAAPELPLFINLEFGPGYDMHVQRHLPRRSRQHIVLGNALMGLRYLRLRGGMGYFPRPMVQEDLAAARLHLVAGATPMRLGCKALYLSDNPAAAQIRQVVQGLRSLRGASNL